MRKMGMDVLTEQKTPGGIPGPAPQPGLLREVQRTGVRGGDSDLASGDSGAKGYL